MENNNKLLIETGSVVPKQIASRAAQRFSKWSKEHLKMASNFDSRVADVMRKYGTKRVSRIIDEAIRLQMSQSIVDYDMLMTTLSRFLEQPQAHNPKGLVDYERAVSTVRRSVLAKLDKPLVPLQITTTEELYKHLPKKDASSGYLGVVTGYREKGDNLETILRCMQHKLDNVDTCDYSPIIFGIRTNISGITEGEEKLNPHWKCKTRPIHIVSADDVAIEMLTAQPLMNHLCGLDWYAGGKNPFTLRRQIRDYRRAGIHWMSIDYSAYDSSLPDWLIRDAFNILFDCFGENISEGYKRFIIEGFLYARMILPNGEIRRKKKGVPSGSYFTQAIDSVCNAIMTEWYFQTNGKVNEEFHKYIIMGDDNLVFTRFPVDFHDWSKFLRRKCDVVMHPHKCESGRRSDTPKFLSRGWEYTGEIRDIREIVVKAINPEHYRDYSTGDLDPVIVVYSLFFVYGNTMRQYFSMPMMKLDYGNLKKLDMSRMVRLGSLPGSVQYKLVYLDGVSTVASEKLYDRG